ncbi:ABC-three component system protein [Mesorhizobium sp. M0674]|uniref:ABC-three component system protein n=1 Tax=Mesorhizobium sp. M0674 TaxID=2956983 RepID=UPI00333CB64A
MLDLPEDGAVYIERNDDVEFVSTDAGISLASLKHKASGERLSDLSIDFWKSVRIWLAHYKATGMGGSDARFLLFSTASVSSNSFLNLFVGGHVDDDARAEAAARALALSESREIAKVRAELDDLTAEEARDFYGRITIFPTAPRINEIPMLVDQRLRTIRREFRVALFERLEGWWTDVVIKLLSGERKEPIKVQEVSDKLAALADEYRADNLPITFRNRHPDGKVDAANDSRVFVEQLRVLELPAGRIQNAILDYYRAFEQRSSWARENLLVSGEVEEYEDRLVEEWAHFREIAFETIVDDSPAGACIAAGKELYRWAEMETESLRIRERVTEPYVVRGAFHILANSSPSPRVYWHPRFMQRLAQLLGVAA